MLLMEENVATPTRALFKSREEELRSNWEEFMENKELHSSNPICIHLISAFLAMEPTDCLISMARECGRGSITEAVQRFIWEHCINQAMSTSNAPSGVYVKNFLKKVIVDVESSCGEVLDELYEQFSYYMTSLKENGSGSGSLRVIKTISFLFPTGIEVASCPVTNKVVVPLQCSLNILEGDTGCAIWPSSLFLSEFILSYPEIFSNKTCFEVGSGVGLVGICLAYVKASKVIMSDGYMSTLENMKLNLELNQFNGVAETSQGIIQDPSLVECKYLQWECASISNLQGFQPDIILGADVIYNPSCLPHLIHALSILLSLKTPDLGKERCRDPSSKNGCIGSEANEDKLGHSQLQATRDDTSSISDHGNDEPSAEFQCYAVNASRIAYLATVIRNEDTFNYFLKLADQAHLSVVEITENCKPLNLLPYMRMYDRSSVRLLTISISHN